MCVNFFFQNHPPLAQKSNGSPISVHLGSPVYLLVLANLTDPVLNSGGYYST